jgi:hypothetical protein
MDIKKRLENKKKELEKVYRQLIQQKNDVENKLVLTKGGYAVLDDLLNDLDKDKSKSKSKKTKNSNSKKGGK